jgi:hypothetical protein
LEVEVWRSGGLEVWRLWRYGGDQRFWTRSKGLEEVSKALEEVEGSEAVSMKLWRWQEALEVVKDSLVEVRGSGGG